MGGGVSDDDGGDDDDDYVSTASRFSEMIRFQTLFLSFLLLS